MKSFKHEHLFYLHSYMSSQHTLSYDQMSSHISTLNDVLNLRYRPHYYKYKDLYYTQQNH